MAVPQFDALFNPVLKAMRQLGGSASISELDEEVAKILALGEEDLARPHKNGTGTELEYRLAWARTYLKAYGCLDNSQRGVWALTAKGRETDRVDPRAVTRYVRGLRKSADGGLTAGLSKDVAEVEAQETWREELLRIVLHMPPDAFERLAQRMLRESGFTQVTVTGSSGDGGIDGTGIVQLGGLLSFPVLFQCKRHRGSVGAGVVRDFRGAMVGRAERGLIITTGTFTRDARAEASRDGAPLIDLVDGEQLLDKLKELRLGVTVSVRTVEDVAVVDRFFSDI
jgi:restriction system protein